MPLNSVKDIIGDQEEEFGISNKISISNKIFARFIYDINNFRLVSPNIFIGNELVDYVAQQYNYIPSPMNYKGTENLIGKIASADVYVSPDLYEYEYFIGTDPKEIQIQRRKDKVNNILTNMKKT